MPAASPTTTADRPLLEVRHLSKRFPVFRRGLTRRPAGWIRAVENVGFDVMPRETLGLVGESGCGKTTTVRCILRAIRPTQGRVLFRAEGVEADLAAMSETSLKPLRPRMQMIFQDPFSSLNPRMTVGEIVGEPLAIHRLGTRGERDERVAAILEKVGLEPAHRHRYPHAFSGGQRQRIGIARALVMRPALVVADEPVSALDVSVQAQVINLLQDLRDEFGLAYIFVAHDLSVVRHICDRVAVMYAGRIVELAPTTRLFEDPRHPYTRMLLAAVPNPDPDRRMSFETAGEIPDPADLPPGCSFHPRCPECFDRCRAEAPELRDVGAGRTGACHLYDR